MPSRIPEIHTTRIPFIGNPTNRDTVSSHDQRYVNVYFDVLLSTEGKKYYYLVKRPGYSQQIQPSGGAGVGRGVYVWKGDIYSVIGTQIYKNSTNLGVTLTTSTGLVDFQETRPGAAVQYLCLTDGVKLFCIATNGAVTTVTVNFPNPNVGCLQYMDTYLFALDANGIIYQSNADDPTTWDNTKTISLNMYNGIGRSLARQNNILIAFTDRHFQGFWDNANASGSVLNNYEQIAQQLGCVSDSVVAHHESQVFFVSDSKLGGFGVYLLQGMTDLQLISTPGIDRILRQEGTSIGSAIGSLIRIAGHRFYVLKLASANRTLVYDIDVQMWLEWQSSDGSSALPLVSYAQYNDTLIAQHATNGWIYVLSENTYQDDGVNFTVFGRFSRFDGDTVSRKFVKSVDLLGDQQSTSTVVQLQYSDDDYKTLSTARNFDMTNVRNKGRNFGVFRRRAWQITYTGSNPLRLEGLEMKYRLNQI